MYSTSARYNFIFLDMGFKTLKLEDKALIDRFLKLHRHDLSCYAAQNIYIWQGLFRISYEVIDGNLCLFFKDKVGCFMYLPPLGREIKPKTVEQAFGVMDKFNSNREVSRIENIEAEDVSFYRKLGYAVREKYGDYLYWKSNLSRLKGNQFKSQRASFNYFVKNHRFEYLPFSPHDKKECLELYLDWADRRKSKNTDLLYQGMIEDSRTCLEILLDNYRALDFQGRIVRIGGKIRAFTFGFNLNKNTFCISQEITDLSKKGLAQFIFRCFCRDLEGFRYINTMDDSGLDNLKRVKQAYRPIKVVKNYIATRQ